MRENEWLFSIYSENFGVSTFSIRLRGKTKPGEYTMDIQINKHPSYESRRKGVMESVYINNLIQTTGICWVCGEIHPRVLERHHLYEGRKGNTLRSDFVIGLCANCHRKRKSLYLEKHQIAILKAIEKEFLGGD